MTRAVVIDTSALLASHEREQHEELGRLHARTTLIAPVLLGFEVGHVIHRKRAEAFCKTAAQRTELVTTLLSDIELVAPDQTT